MAETTQRRKKIKQSIPTYVQTLIESGAPIDRGWAWVICFAVFVLHIHISGLSRIGGIILSELFIEFERSRAETSLLITMVYVVMAVSGTAANWLSMKISPRFVIFIGGLSMSLGLGVSSFASSLPVFIFIFSGFIGVGFGFIYTPSIAVVSQYFYHHRSLAVGLSISGSGIGAFVVPPLVSYLITQFTFRGMLLIMSAVYLHIFVSASLLRPFEFFTGHADNKVLIVDHRSSQQVTKSTPFWQQPLFRNPHLYITTVTMSVISEGLILSYMLIPPMAFECGISPQQVTTLLISMGIPDIVGRTTMGWFADKDIIRRWMLVFILGLLEVVLFVGVTFNTTFVTMALFAVVMGAVGGSLATLIGPVIADAVGIANINAGLAVMSVAKVLSLPIPVLLGAVRDTTGKWAWSYRVLAVILLSVSLLILLTKCVKDSRKEPKEKITNEDYELDEVEGDDLIKGSTAQRVIFTSNHSNVWQ